MAKEQGNSVGGGTLLVDVVDVECAKAIDINVAGEHGQLFVELLFMLAPVVTVFPSFYESLDICQRGAICPLCVLELVGERGEVEFAVEEVELSV